VLKKIGLFTILGLLLLILSGIVYFSAFTASSYYSQNTVIGISGILAGFFFIVIDFIFMKKKDIINEIHPKLFILGKIITASFFALLVDTIIFSTSIREYAMLLGGILCLTVFIPAIIIVIGLFLIFVRTPLGKSITNKKENIFCIILAILLIILPVYTIWPSISPTYMDRQPTIQLHLSSDGTKLLSISGGMPLVPVKKYQLHYVYDYIIWNTTSGKIIWNTTVSNYQNPKTYLDYYYATISPDGRYFINIDNNSLIAIESGETNVYFSGTYYDWTGNGKYFVTMEDQQITIWNAMNFTKIKMIPINGKVGKITLSQDGSKLFVEIHTQTQSSLQLIDVLFGNSTSLYNYTGSGWAYNIKYLTLSKDGNKLQMIKYESTSNTSSHYFDNYLLTIWNISDKKILYNYTFKIEWSQNILFGAEFGKYITFDSKKSQLIFYNLTGVETAINTNQNFRNFDLSYDESIMAIGAKGTIEIRNATTGLLINTLKTPVYEIERPIPGFEIIIVFGAIASVLILIRFRRKKYRF
jgi:hypothetical protein